MTSAGGRQLISKVKSRIPNRFRQTGSTASQEDGSLPSTKPSYLGASPSCSSTANLRDTGAEHKGDRSAGNAPAVVNPLVPMLPPTTNVVLFGETGVGKSSVVNLIARKQVANFTSSAQGCTLESTRHDIFFDDMHFAIFDTIGLEEPQLGVNGYLKAIEKAYELIEKLTAAGGIHLLLFCMRGGRITGTTQSNYRLFSECLCRTKVPIALVFTNLEIEVEMEDWWLRNKEYVKQYGIKHETHACITAVYGDTPGEDLKYTESRRKIRELLKPYALQNKPFREEKVTWLTKLGAGLRSFVPKPSKLKRKQIMSVLTQRCKLDPETAGRVADMMERGDTEEAGGEGRSIPEGEKDGNEGAMKNEAGAEPSVAIWPENDRGAVAHEQAGKMVTQRTLKGRPPRNPQIAGMEG